MTASSSDAVIASQASIIKHIEWYFGDFNLSRNNVNKKKIQDCDGWVTINTMLKLNGMKKITDNAQMICEALKKSSSGLIEVSEQGDKIRRSPSKPLPGDTKETREEFIARTVYAKPFPLDVKLDDLLEFFENYGQLDNVSKKKEGKQFRKKTFKGTVRVTFANKEDADKFVSEEETKFKEQALEVKRFKNKYLNDKAAQGKAKGNKDTEGKQHTKVEDKTKAEETEADLEETVSQMMTKNAVLHIKGLNSKNKNNVSSDGEEQETEEPPAKVIKTEMAITFKQVMKKESASSDRKEQDTKKPPAKVTKWVMKIARPQSKTKRRVERNKTQNSHQPRPASPR